MDRRTALIETNVRWLNQALRLLERMDDQAYATAPVGMTPHRAGGHLRHIIEFYRAFLDGVGGRYIDYDARPRDSNLERSREAAAAAICKIIRELETNALLRVEALLRVRMEYAEGIRELYMESSVSRELQVLSGHTIHHFALLALVLSGHGVETDADFGTAPSTLRFRRSKAAAAA